MVEGPSSPELEEEDYGRELIGIGGHGDNGIGDRGKTAGGRNRGEEEDKCTLPRKRKWHKKRTKKEVTNLINSISFIRKNLFLHSMLTQIHSMSSVSFTSIAL